jgi:beta-phosphoglucomutase-like phosphatase (HAD superfamily)
MAILEPLLKELELSHYFQCFATGDLVLRAKPAPDVFLLAAVMLKVAPHACLVIEDSPNGIRAAKAAGMTCIEYSPIHSSTNRREADFVISNFDEITVEFIRSICPESLK